MDDPVWRDIGALLDERWFVDIPIDQAMQRVVERHIGTGLSRDKV
jgi:pantothenate kinase